MNDIIVPYALSNNFSNPMNDIIVSYALSRAKANNWRPGTFKIKNNNRL